MIVRLVLAVLLASSLGACCCGPPTEPNPRRHAVRLEGRYYLLFSDTPAPTQGGPAMGAEYARVARQVPCEGIILRTPAIEDPCDLQDGDSSVLPAGTTLHPVDGLPAAQRLGAVSAGRLLLFHAYFPPD
jgi:hypothetical protein